jgi:hypothetical protein
MIQSSGHYDIFIHKSDSDGNLIWAKTVRGYNGSTNGYPKGAALDDNGNVYVTGYFSGTNLDFDTSDNNELLFSSGAYNDIFVMKLDANGDFAWAKQLIGSSDEKARDIDVDNSGLYFVGYFSGDIDLDPGSGTQNFTAQSSNDGFLEKMDLDGNFLWGKVFQPDHEIKLTTVYTTGNHVYTAGRFIYNHAVYDPAGENINLNETTGKCFFMKTDTSGTFAWTYYTAGGNSSIIRRLITDDSDHIYMVGEFSGNRDFDPTNADYMMSDNGWGDFFVEKISQNNAAISNHIFSNISIYPNPADEILYINTGRQNQMQLELYDMTGKKISGQKLNSGLQNLDLSQMDEGIYFIRMLLQGNSQTYKLFIHH